MWITWDRCALWSPCSPSAMIIPSERCTGVLLMPLTRRFLSGLQGDAAPTRLGGSYGSLLLPGLPSALQNKDTTMAIQFDPYFFCHSLPALWLCGLQQDLFDTKWAPRISSNSKVASLKESYFWKAMKPLTQNLWDFSKYICFALNSSPFEVCIFTG